VNEDTDVHDDQTVERLRAALTYQDAALEERVRRRLLAGTAARTRGKRVWGRWLLVGLAVAALSGGLALAGGSILDLGKPTSNISTISYFPLDRFHRIKQNLRAHGKPEVLYLGTTLMYDSRSAYIRWPMIKALSQFGTFAQVVPVKRTCLGHDMRGNPNCEQLAAPDWSRARYSSRYIAFVHKDLVNDQAKLFQRMTPTERALFYRYARTAPRFKSDPDGIISSVSFGFGQSTHSLPLVLIGDYLQTLGQIVIDGDFDLAYPPPPGTPTEATYKALTLQQVRDSLAAGKNPPQNAANLVGDVNAEANIMTALICHATKNQPTSVCTRPTIRLILKSVR